MFFDFLARNLSEFIVSVTYQLLRGPTEVVSTDVVSLELAVKTSGTTVCTICCATHSHNHSSLPFETIDATMVDRDLGLDHDPYDPYIIGTIEEEDTMEGVFELLQGDDLSEWQDSHDEVSPNNIPSPSKASVLPNSVITASHPDPNVPSRLFNLQLATGFEHFPKPSLAYDGFSQPSSCGLAMAALNASIAHPTASAPMPPSLSSALFQGYSSDPSDSLSSSDVLNAKKSTGCRRRSFSDDELTLSKSKYHKV